MNLKRGLTRSAIVAAIVVFGVGVVHKLLSERMAGLFGDPFWLHGILGILVAAGVVLAVTLLLLWIAPGFLGRIHRWVVRGFKRPIT